MAKAAVLHALILKELCTSPGARRLSEDSSDIFCFCGAHFPRTNGPCLFSTRHNDNAPAAPKRTGRRFVISVAKAALDSRLNGSAGDKYPLVLGEHPIRRRRHGVERRDKLLLFLRPVTARQCVCSQSLRVSGPAGLLWPQITFPPHAHGKHTQVPHIING